MSQTSLINMLVVFRLTLCVHHQGRRVRLPMDILECLFAYLGINLRGAEIVVTQHFLDMADVCTIVQHVGRHRMAKQMASAQFTDPRQGFEVTDFLADLIAV